MLDRDLGQRWSLGDLYCIIEGLFRKVLKIR